MFPTFRDSGPFLNLLPFPTGGAGIPAPAITVGPVWTDNADGTATVTFTTDIATYGGIDFGTSTGVYTQSAFDYDGAGPALELATSHTVPVPDAMAGGTLPDDTYYYRVWGGTPAGFSGYISAEDTGTISTSSPVVYDNFSTSSEVSDTVNSWTHTPTGTPTKVFVGITWFNSADSITSVTYGGAAMSLVQSVTNGSTEVAAIYGILSPAAGAQTVTVNWGSSAVSRCGAVSVTGGDLTTLVRGTSATNTGSSTTPSVVQTSDAVDLVFAVMVADDVDGLPITAGSGVDARWGLAAFTAITSWGVTKAGAASVTANGTMSAFRPWGMVSCSIKGT